MMDPVIRRGDKLEYELEYKIEYKLEYKLEYELEYKLEYDATHYYRLTIQTHYTIVTPSNDGVHVWLHALNKVPI